jgi:hypothetical protein
VSQAQKSVRHFRETTLPLQVVVEQRNPERKHAPACDKTKGKNMKTLSWVALVAGMALPCGGEALAQRGGGRGGGRPSGGPSRGNAFRGGYGARANYQPRAAARTGGLRVNAAAGRPAGAGQARNAAARSSRVPRTSRMPKGAGKAKVARTARRSPNRAAGRGKAANGGRPGARRLAALLAARGKGSVPALSRSGRRPGQGGGDGGSGGSDGGGDSDAGAEAEGDGGAPAESTSSPGGEAAEEPEAEAAPVYGMRVTLVADGPAQDAGMLVGDVILSVNGTPTPDFASLRAALEGSGDEAEFVIVNVENGAVERMNVGVVETRIRASAEQVRVE